MTQNTGSTLLSAAALVVALGAAAFTGWATQNSAPGEVEVAQAVVEQPAAADSLDRAQVETIVREYLLENPTVMLEVQQALEVRQREEREEAQRVALNERKDIIFSSEHQLEIGNPDAPITIVEFFDYNCGFCQRALADMNRFVEEDKDVRFVMKEFPVLGEASLDAHKVSLAFNQLMPEKVEEFHVALMGAPGRKDGDMALQLAMQLGVDEAAMKAEIDKPYILDAIKEVYGLADALGITGTPSYVIGDEVVFGAVGFDQLNAKVTAMKECGKASC